VGQVDANGNVQPGVTGPYAYDIHYFFTGSLNTAIDYRTFDPLNTTHPGASWTSPDGTTFSFTQQEFDSVKYQVHNEVVALTNVLTYLVTGSTHFKDLVAAGNSNAALSLLQAVLDVQANIAQIGMTPPPTTPATVYANSPDMELVLSQPALDVSYSDTSSAVSLNVNALYGMTGTVNFACSGLPAG
jgi:hypothetical protein